MNFRVSVGDWLLKDYGRFGLIVIAACTFANHSASAADSTSVVAGNESQLTSDASLDGSSTDRRNPCRKRCGPPSDDGNDAPAISGTAPTSVLAEHAYDFSPAATDPDGDALIFSVSHKPSWATFSTSTWRLRGTPGVGDVGNYSDITISVTDGQLTTNLQPFSISVLAVANGSASLSWQPPTRNTDGSTLTDLAGYEIVYGLSKSNLSQKVTIKNAGVTSAIIENLTAGTWHFAVKAFNTAGVMSDASSLSSKSIL
jgi:hypothetical protein